MLLILVEELAMWVATPSKDSTGRSSGVSSSVCYKSASLEEAGAAEATPTTPTGEGKPRSTAAMSVSVSSAGFKAYGKLKSGSLYMSKKIGLLSKSSPKQVKGTDSDCFHLMDIEDLLDPEVALQLSCDGAMILGSQGLPASKALCLFVALSFHSVMEGIGLGTAKKASVLISISVAILAHKSLAAFALGSALCKTNLSGGRFASMAVVFSSGTPAGIAIGSVVAEHFKGPAVAVCTAIAAGTFLQISLMEIIPSVLQPVAIETSAVRLLRISFISFGYLMMCLTIYLVGG